jgi:hypothetical protein
MTRVPIASAKLTCVFHEGELPEISPDDPAFVLVMGGLEIHGKVTAKEARKLAAHTGGAVLQGKLVPGPGWLQLEDAGFSWIDPRPGAEAIETDVVS